MDGLTGSRTLNQLLDRLLHQLFPPMSAPDGAFSVASNSHGRPEGDQRPFEEAAAEALIGRFTLRLAHAPPIREVGDLARSGVIVITDDERGIAQNLEGIL